MKSRLPNAEINPHPWAPRRPRKQESTRVVTKRKRKPEPSKLSPRIRAILERTRAAMERR